MPSVAQHLPTQEDLVKDTGMDLDIYQCSGCGLVQLVTEPVSYYKEVIRAVAYSPEMKEFRIKQFTDFVNKYSLTGKKIIEIGAGKGEYLDLLITTGADCYGMEYSKDSVAECQKKNLKVSEGFLENENYKIPSGPFDSFLNISFFEHLPEPNQILRGIYNNLNDDAVGLVEVPNFDMILRDKLFSEFMRDHLFYFTKSTLTTALEKNGFEVLAAKEVWHDYILSFEVKKRSPINLSSFREDQIKVQTDIEKYLSEFKNVAIWGAGHQAFAIMSIMQLGGRIKYIVDSATFKQGKFSPATHIPILSPETLNTNPVDAVIIMTGSYSDEVKKIVKEKYPNIKTSILRDNGLERD
jgi:cyclopropane fatty-acyl-phospholipid synthase-like methyltransferase